MTSLTCSPDAAMTPNEAVVVARALASRLNGNVERGLRGRTHAAFCARNRALWDEADAAGVSEIVRELLDGREDAARTRAHALFGGARTSAAGTAEKACGTSAVTPAPLTGPRAPLDLGHRWFRVGDGDSVSFDELFPGGFDGAPPDVVLLRIGERTALDDNTAITRTR